MPNNKRAISQNCFSRDTGNLREDGISSLYRYKFLPKVDDLYIKGDINRIDNISNKLLLYSNKIISYLEL